jgi:hypothetical protein
LTIIANCVSGFEQLVDPAHIPKEKRSTTFRATTISKAVFGPKQINRAGLCPVTSLDVVLGQFGAFTHLYIYGVVIYHDIFDQSSWRLTRFCFQAGNFVIGGTENDPTMNAIVVLPCESGASHRPARDAEPNDGYPIYAPDDSRMIVRTYLSLC